jgi:hypothetical protein
MLTRANLNIWLPHRDFVDERERLTLRLGRTCPSQITILAHATRHRSALRRDRITEHPARDPAAAADPAVKAGKHKPPSCEYGEWTFAGSDTKRGASKWCCPTGECKPASVWLKADRLHTLTPRGTERWKGLYHQRGSVEREFGRLKHEGSMPPLRSGASSGPGCTWT